jgi:hypothetical protein
MDGPSSTAAKPVPQGWEHVPAVGTGTGMQEMMNTTAATMPASGLLDRSWAERLAKVLNPRARNGAEAANQNAAQLKGRMPSEMCIAKEEDGTKNREGTTDKRMALRCFMKRSFPHDRSDYVSSSQVSWLRDRPVFAPSHPLGSGLLRRRSPFTVAGQRRIRTGFPLTGSKMA